MIIKRKRNVSSTLLSSSTTMVTKKCAKVQNIIITIMDGHQHRSNITNFIADFINIVVVVFVKNLLQLLLSSSLSIIIVFATTRTAKIS